MLELISSHEKLNIIGVRGCNKCLELKPLDQFPLKGRGEYRGTWCNDCVLEWQNEHYSGLEKDNLPDEKVCKTCKQGKPLAEFNRQKGNNDGLKAVCKTCGSTACSNYQEKSGYNLRKYGLTTEEYESRRVKQEHKCLICGVHESQLKRKLVVDHDHVTGVIRGLLCGKCNSGLGFFKDSQQSLSVAISYLKEYQ